jgi:nucleoside-diphosphate-sugar epimerase
MKKILVTGGCGYKGHILVPKLLEKGYFVKVIDTQWFGNFHKKHKNLEILQKDIRSITPDDVDQVQTIVHLAAVANDPCSDLDPKLSWEIGSLGTMLLADLASKSNVEQFIYSSSGSVYGVKEEESVTEDLQLDPISEYNKNKMVSERVLMSYKDSMNIQIVRPATVCGLSPRMRLDVAVNMLTMQALTKKQITVLGGNQTRPNIHIQDITNLYLFFLENPDVVGIFNAGFENISIIDIAKKIKEKLPSTNILVKESNDPRSYRVDSNKLLSKGFKPKFSVENAIEEIIEAYKNNFLKDEDKFYNLRWMKETGIL